MSEGMGMLATAAFVVARSGKVTLVIVREAREAIAARV